MGALKFQTKELPKKTWPDYERLFRKPGEWGGCWCVYYHRTKPVPRVERERLTKEQRIARNRQDKKVLVEEGRSHGELVYSGDEPVGWCQYGLRDELPRIDAKRTYRKLSLDAGGEKLWRITCFCVDRKYRKRGVARVGLKAALDSIRRRGGGLVEAYPTTGWKDLESWFGTASMFEDEGFKTVAPLGKNNVLMRRVV